MGDAIISVRVDETTHQEMKRHEDINWSAIIRSSINEKIESLYSIDLDRATKARTALKKIRKMKCFSGGKDGTEIIREWRDKRK